MKRKVIVLIIGLVFACFYQAQCQQFVYKPLNPAFGGETFNYQWMLSAANAQNSFTDENADEDEELTDLEEFTAGLNRQILNRINRLILDSQFDIDGNLEPGLYSFGSLSVEVFDSVDGLVVNILDTDTGEQTQVIIPN